MFELSEKLKKELARANKLLFFTGAGISAESGVSTFRGDGGIWNKFKPEELASFQAFMKNADMVWEWYQYRRGIIHEVVPNAAHLVITELQRYYPSVVVVTQNVDNLHNRAGNSEVYELHGNIEKNYCTACKKRYDYVTFDNDTSVPRCECGGMIRPDVVWFGEGLPDDQYDAAEYAAEQCDVCFSVGTSSIVYPAAHIPLRVKSAKKYVVEINITETEHTKYFDEIILGKAGEILPAILEEVKKFKKPL
jgi:NAD-dependent deacetylase